MKDLHKHMVNNLKKAYNEAKKLTDPTRKNEIDDLLGELFWAEEEGDERKIISIYYSKYLPYKETHWYFFE